MEAKPLVETMAARLSDLEVDTLVDTIANVDAKATIDTLAYRLSGGGRRTWRHSG